MKLKCALVLLVLSLSACDFQLRGSQSNIVSNVSNLHIRGTGNISDEVKIQLLLAGTNIKNSSNSADYVLSLTNESFDRSILTVSPNFGKIEEYRLVLNVDMSVSSSSGANLVTNEKITVSRDYAFDRNTILANSSEEKVLQEDLAKRAADQIIRRLNASIKSR